MKRAGAFGVCVVLAGGLLLALAHRFRESNEAAEAREHEDGAAPRFIASDTPRRADWPSAPPPPPDSALAVAVGPGSAGAVPKRGSTASKEALRSPERAVESAVSFLRRGDDDSFRATFLPEVRDRITVDVVAACRQRVSARDVRPDWEMAEHESDGGRRVVRVSMFGKSTTGFVETEEGWLADAPWCVPVWQGPPEGH